MTYSAFGFYHDSQDIVGDDEEAAVGAGGAKAFMDGLKRCAFAWVFVLLPTYFWCEFKGGNSESSLVDAGATKRKSRRLEKKRKKTE